ncbi:MAG: DNA polymerase III subunit delta [Ignavibacteria bacterium]|nr:DNA polymerase III subunit delta [Ignavibacteria bacterium]
MLTFLDFEREVSGGKIRNVYYISAADNYFIQKAGKILREKLFKSNVANENFFLKYADETPMQELFDLTQSGASLFASNKLIIVKRCEKYSRKLTEFLKQSKIPQDDTYILYVFDTSFVNEKKLYKNNELELFDFSELPQKQLYDWVKNEFKIREIEINNDALELFISYLPLSFDIMITEIEKISNYDFGNSHRLLTSDLILHFVGYDKGYSPNELVIAIFSRDKAKAFNILNNLLNSKGLNELYLLAFISNFYFDMLIFKTQGTSKLDSGTLYNKYKLWGDSLKIIKNYHNSFNISSLESSINNILDTDKNMKLSMNNPKILMTSLVEILLNA